MRAASIPKGRIQKFFDEMGPRAYSITQLSSLMAQHRQDWLLPRSFDVDDLANLLEAKLRRVELRSTEYRALLRYVWGELSPFQLALTIRKGAFLSHGTAAFLHDLTDQIPHTIYVNAEQSPKPAGRSTLTQEGINRAFKAKQRTSQLIYAYGEWRLTVLAGKNTGRMEVGAIPGPNNEPLEATKLERTLIDLAVRPAYAGGPRQVLEAFQRARDRISTNVLIATLKKFAYVYPYHQVLGYYMERAGFAADKLERLKNLPMSLKFYLVHGVKEPEFVPQWKLFVPRKL